MSVIAAEHTDGLVARYKLETLGRSRGGGRRMKKILIVALIGLFSISATTNELVDTFAITKEINSRGQCVGLVGACTNPPPAAAMMLIGD